MEIIKKIKIQKEQKKYYKTLKKDIKKNYKKEIKESKFKIKNSNSKDEIKKIKNNLYNIKQDNKFLIEDQKEKIIELEPTKLGKNIKKHKKCVFIILILCLIFTFLGLSIYNTNKLNYKNDYFSFHYNEKNIYINDYSKISNMWIVSTGGGIYSPSLVMIGYTEDGKDLKVNQPLSNLKDKFGGKITKETKSNTSTFASDDYILKLDKLKYQVLSKSYKKDNKILTIIFVNAGDLKDKEQKELYQVYNSIKIN